MHSTDAHCFSCGYDRPLMVGSLMSNFDEYSAWPVLCERCKEITTANHKATPLTCEVCKSSSVLRIDHPANWLGDRIDEWGEVVPVSPSLRTSDVPSLLGHYKCPYCGKFDLRFGTNYLEHAIRSSD